MSLQNLFEKTVFLFGAGVSKDAGCLLSKEMLCDLEKSIRDPKISWPNRKKHFLDIYNFIKQSLLYQYGLKDMEVKVSEVTNIEDFVLVLQQIIDREYIVPPPLIGNWNNKLTLWESKSKNVFQDFYNFIHNRLINKWTKFDNKKAQNLLNPFQQLICSDEKFDLRIFSLNYDTIFEKTFNKADEHLVDTGFSKNQWIGDFNDPQTAKKIKFYKLHGSIDWYFDDEEETVKQGRVDQKPLIIFGSGSKIQSYDPFLSLLSSFNEVLKKANLFVIIGYSFQDRYINNILIQNLSSHLNKKILIVDPDKKEKEFFIKKIEQFQKSKSMNEIVSLTKISPDKIDLNYSKSIDFFKEYLNENCKKLKELVNSVEKEDTIF